MIVYQPVIKATQEQLAKCDKWRSGVMDWADGRGYYYAPHVRTPVGFNLPQAEKDYAILLALAAHPYTICLDWDVELLPGFEVGGDEIWVGEPHEALIYNGTRTDVFAELLAQWHAHQHAVEEANGGKPLWLHEGNKLWSLINEYRKEHPEVKFNQIPKSTYIHHAGSVR